MKNYRGMPLGVIAVQTNISVNVARYVWAEIFNAAVEAGVLPIDLLNLKRSRRHGEGRLESHRRELIIRLRRTVTRDGKIRPEGDVPPGDAITFRELSLHMGVVLRRGITRAEDNGQVKELRRLIGHGTKCGAPCEFYGEPRTCQRDARDRGYMLRETT